MRKIFLCAMLACTPASAQAAAPADWGRIPATSVTLFYPGQSSHEWLLGDHKGAAALKGGATCTTCHAGKQKAMGNSIVKGGKLEPTPVKGKNGWVDVGVQAAYDSTHAYLRLQWKTLSPFGGTEHQYLRYDGAEWKVHGYPKLDKVVQEAKQPAIYEDRMSIMIDDGKVADFAKQGCWLSCHDGQRDMAKQFTKEEVAANPLYAAIKKGDVRKYLPSTRTEGGDWKAGRSVEEIAKIKAGGGYVDLIQWRAHRSNAVAMADDGYVLEFRLSDAGKDMFSSNADAKTHAPRFMWDAGKTGYRSIRDADLRRADHFLVADVNAVPFDPAAGWKEGDMIPDYLVSRKAAAGSAADNNATASWKDGQWTVVLVRPLGLVNADDKALREGQVYNIGLAAHDDNITTCGHFVSFPLRLGIGVDADIRAVKLP